MIESIDTLIKSRDFPHVFLLFGEENFLLEEAYDKLIKTLCPDENSKYDLEVFAAQESDIEKVVRSLNMSLPIRKIIVRLRMFWADIRGHHGKRWDYEPGDYYMGRKHRRGK